ncbi:MAG: YtxH domain-containing protein [Polyangia bacterium]|jgi:hypothetical protein
MKLKGLNKLDKLGDKLGKDQLLALVGLQLAASPTEKVLGTGALIVVGAVLGASLALLWAPKPGREVRRAIRRRLQNGADELADLLPDKQGWAAGI